jgi:hypothetical protein
VSLSAPPALPVVAAPATTAAAAAADDTYYGDLALLEIFSIIHGIKSFFRPSKRVWRKIGFVPLKDE